MNNQTRQPPAWIERLAIVVSVVLLCGAANESRKFRPPPDTREYLDRVQAAAATIPLNIGPWQGESIPVELAAVKLLRPKVILSQRFHNPNTGVTADFLFVDCSDARDTVGHYPPICYPSQGYSSQLAVTKDWQLPHMTVHGTEYTFVRGVFDAGGTLVVDDFFVLPGLGTRPDRQAVITAAGDLQRRFYGVAQVQLVFDGRFTAQQRDQAFLELIGPMENVLQTVRTIRPGQNQVTQTSAKTPPPAGNGDPQ